MMNEEILRLYEKQLINFVVNLFDISKRYSGENNYKSFFDRISRDNDLKNVIAFSDYLFLDGNNIRKQIIQELTTKFTSFSVNCFQCYDLFEDRPLVLARNYLINLCHHQSHGDYAILIKKIKEEFNFLIDNLPIDK